MEKIVYISNNMYEDKTVVNCRTSFPLIRYLDNRTEVVVDSFEFILNSLSNHECQIIDNNNAIIPKIDIWEIKNKLEKWGFKVFNDVLDLIQKEDVLKVENKLDTERPAVFKRKLGDIKEIGLSIQDYIDSGSSIKLLDKILDIPEKSLTVEQVFINFLEFIKIKNSDISVALTFINFASYIEQSNKIVCYLNKEFKGKDRLDFFKKRRNDKVYSIYNHIYNKIGDIGVNKSFELNGELWYFVDAVKLYEKVYKFGTKNRKQFFIYKKHIVLKLFKNKYVYIFRKDILNDINKQDYIQFNIWK